jgi:hypothetical protein
MELDNSVGLKFSSLGGILFAARYGQNFDEDIKMWRFYSSIYLNAAILIEIMTLAFPNHFLALASIANVGKYY